MGYFILIVVAALVGMYVINKMNVTPPVSSSMTGMIYNPIQEVLNSATGELTLLPPTSQNVFTPNNPIAGTSTGQSTVS